MWKEFNSVRDTDGFCCRDVALIVTVMVVTWPNVEFLCAVISPEWSLSCSVVNNHLASSWG